MQDARFSKHVHQRIRKRADEALPLGGVFMRPKWIISVRTHKSSKNFILKGPEGQTDLDFYKQVIKLKAQEIRNQYAEAGIPVTVDTISGHTAFKPPKNSSAPKNHYWCPFCVKYRIFTWREDLGVYRCPVCGISDHEYWVRKYNDLFKRDWMEAVK